jgi:hypothetical protein
MQTRAQSQFTRGEEFPIRDGGEGGRRTEKDEEKKPRQAHETKKPHRDARQFKDVIEP